LTNCNQDADFAVTSKLWHQKEMLYIGRLTDQHRNSTGDIFVAILFSLFTTDCLSLRDDYIITKYADDTVLTEQITDNDDTHFRHEVDTFVQRCDQNNQELNVCITKEMSIDFRRNLQVPDFVLIKGVEANLLRHTSIWRLSLITG